MKRRSGLILGCLLAGAIWVAVRLGTADFSPANVDHSRQNTAGETAPRSAAFRRETKAEVDRNASVDVVRLWQSGALPDSVRFVDGTGQFTEAFLKMFEIQCSELTELNQVIGRTRIELARLQKEHACVIARDANEVEFTIDTFPLQGGRVYDKMMASCASILGGARGEAFVTLCGQQLEQSLGGAMGCDRMKGTISRTGTDGQDWTVVISNAGELGPTLDKMYHFDNTAAMQRQIGALADLIRR